jgi:inward rectifier potassium channel
MAEIDTITRQSARPSQPEDLRDLGFGRVVAQQVRGRFLAKDGSPRSRKYGLGPQRWERFYRLALDVSWPGFFAWLIGLELLANGIFALGYAALPGAIGGSDVLGLADPFLRAFAFSVGIFSTVGTGPLHPVGSTAVWLAAIESLIGPVTLIIAGGLTLARLLRPRSRIRFSGSAVIAPYREGRGLMFRVINVRPSEMSEVRIQVNLVWFDERDGVRHRRFVPLALERSEVEFFTLHWTVVHPIDATSPLTGVTPAILREREAEFLVHLSGLEDTFSTRVSARSSYYWDEVRWDARFADMFVPSPDDLITIDVERLDRFDRLPEGATAVPAPAEVA